MIDNGGTEIALRDQRLANYEAKLRQEDSVSPVPIAMASANAPRSTGHSQMVYPGADSASNTLQVGETVSPWRRHQERAHRLSACAEQPSVGGHYVIESIPRINNQATTRSSASNFKTSCTWGSISLDRVTALIW